MANGDKAFRGLGGGVMNSPIVTGHWEGVQQETSSVRRTPARSRTTAGAGCAGGNKRLVAAKKTAAERHMELHKDASPL